MTRLLLTGLLALLGLVAFVPPVGGCGGRAARETDLALPAPSSMSGGASYWCFAAKLDGEVVVGCAAKEKTCGRMHDAARDNGGMVGISEVGACAAASVTP